VTETHYCATSRSQEYLNESSRLAQAVQEEMNRITGIQSAA